MKNFLKKHKVLYITLAVVLFTLILFGSLMVLYYFKYSATSKAVRYGAKGYVTVEEYNDIRKAGSYILGEEFYDENGNSYDLEVDDQGVLLARTIKNKNGEPVHVHKWIAHHNDNGNLDFCYCPECISAEQVQKLL